MKETDFSRTITKYLLDYLPGQRNVSNNTIRSYRDALKQLIIFVKEEFNTKPEKIEFSNLSVEVIKKFLTWLELIKKVSISTRNQRLATIHSFFRYAITEYPEILLEGQRILSISFKKQKSSPVGYLTQEELFDLLNQPDSSTIKGRRDLVLMTTLYDTAARVQELIDICVKDVRLLTPATISLNGKGNKIRTIPLMNKTKILLSSYMKEHHLLDIGNKQMPLFSNSRYEKFTRPGITYILKKYFNSIPQNQQNKSIHPHMLRHTKAVHMLEAGVALIYIRDYLGHVNISTTEIYLKTETELKRAAIEKAYPIDESRNIPQWIENKGLIQWLEDFCK